MRGARERAAEHAREGARLFDEADMKLHAAAARAREGELLGGSEGAARVDAAHRLPAAEGVVAPQRFAQLLAPAIS